MAIYLVLQFEILETIFILGFLYLIPFPVSPNLARISFSYYFFFRILPFILWKFYRAYCFLSITFTRFSKANATSRLVIVLWRSFAIVYHFVYLIILIFSYIPRYPDLYNIDKIDLHSYQSGEYIF